MVITLRLPVIAAFIAASLVALVVAGSLPARAQTVHPHLPVTNGSVLAIATLGNTVYVGGAFTHMGPASGSACALDPATGKPLGLPRILGAVNAIAPDGAGGWFVGGAFTHVGGVPRQRLAHILPDGTLSSWDPNPSNTVNSLARSGNVLYV